VSIWRQLTRGLRALTDRKRADREIADEVGHYLDESTASFVDKGLGPAEARRAARIELGGPAAVHEQVRSYGWETAVECVCADLRYGARRLLANPGFAAVAVLTLALGIGASTSIFSVADAVLLRPLPYPKAQQIVRIWELNANGRRINIAQTNFDDFRNQSDTFASMGEWEYFLDSISGGSEPVRVNVAKVSGGFFPTMGVEPARGRLFGVEEQKPHGAPSVVVSYGFWQRYLGGTENLAECRLSMEGGVYPVIGVMPPGFDFPAGTGAWISSELDPDAPNRRGHNWRGIGRVRDGVTVGQARANLSTIARRIRQQYGKDVDLVDAVVLPLSDALVGDVRTALLTLLAAVGLLLLVACTNVAGLLLARTSARRRELAVRAALGAGRGRLMQQFLAESLVLSTVSGALGVLLAVWAVRAMPAILPANLPRQEGITVNAPVLLFALLAVIGVAVGLGLFAAWRASAADVHDALSARGSTPTAAAQRVRSLLVIGEIAASLVILVGAGLLGRSFLRLIAQDPGFHVDNLITAEFSTQTHSGQIARGPADIVREIQLIDDIVRRVRAIPGVTGAGFAGAMPVAAGDNLANGPFLMLDGQRPPASVDEFRHTAWDKARTGQALYSLASEDFFKTLGIPVKRGRIFGPQDDWNAPHVALISESLARRQWPNSDPIGKVIEYGNMDGNLKPLTIVGVVGDVRAEGLDQPASSLVYVDYHQRGLTPNTTPTILLRSAAPTAQVVSATRQIFHDLAPEIPVKFSTYGDEMGGWLASRRFLLLLVGAFAAAALSLAAVGIYGVVAFSAARRTQEIGIRMALGGRRVDVLRLIVGEGARLAIAGVAVGVAASLAVTRLLSSLLFGVSATDPLTFAGVAGLLSAVALAASYIPAVRATRLDPTVALRYE